MSGSDVAAVCPVVVLSNCDGPGENTCNGVLTLDKETSAVCGLSGPHLIEDSLTAAIVDRTDD